MQETEVVSFFLWDVQSLLFLFWLLLLLFFLLSSLLLLVFVCLPVCLFVCLFGCCLSVCLYVFSFVCLSVCLSVCLFVCLFVFVPLFVCLFIVVVFVVFVAVVVVVVVVLVVVVIDINWLLLLLTLLLVLLLLLLSLSLLLVVVVVVVVLLSLTFRQGCFYLRSNWWDLVPLTEEECLNQAFAVALSSATGDQDERRFRRLSLHCGREVVWHRNQIWHKLGGGWTCRALRTAMRWAEFSRAGTVRQWREEGRGKGILANLGFGGFFEMTAKQSLLWKQGWSWS